MRLHDEIVEARSGARGKGQRPRKRVGRARSEYEMYVTQRALYSRVAMTMSDFAMHAHKRKRPSPVDNLELSSECSRSVLV